jgi:ferritin
MFVRAIIQSQFCGSAHFAGFIERETIKWLTIQAGTQLVKSSGIGMVLYCVTHHLVKIAAIMKTNRLSDAMRQALNDQMTKEAHAAQIYLSYGAWADDQGYAGIANFLFRHAQEERNHMMKLLEYIQERGARATIDTIPAVLADPTSVQNCFEKVFEQEVENTKAVYRIVKLSFTEEDWATWNFMQWFVKEQTEEETLAMSLLDKIRISGGENAKADALYTLDRDLGNTPDDARLAQDVTADNP